MALAFYSYCEIRTGLPLLTARIVTHPGSSSPVGEVIGLDLYLCLLLQIPLAVLLLSAPYLAPEAIRFDAWCLSRYTLRQRDRIVPLLRELAALLALLVSLYFATRIYVAIHEAQSHGPLLLRDWLNNMIRTELEWLVGLMLVCGPIIFRYLGKFDEVAGGE